jgi:hypothetical protein
MKYHTAVLMVGCAWTLSGCCASSATRNLSPTTAIRGESAGADVTLVTRAVAAGGVGAQLEVTLRVSSNASSPIWLNGRMSSDEIQLSIVDQDGNRLEDLCRHNAQTPVPWDYVVLGPGDALTRRIELRCYDFTNVGVASITATYDDDCKPQHKSPIPESIKEFCGPVRSDAVQIRFR